MTLLIILEAQNQLVETCVMILQSACGTSTDGCTASLGLLMHKEDNSPSETRNFCLRRLQSILAKFLSEPGEKRITFLVVVHYGGRLPAV